LGSPFIRASCERRAVDALVGRWKRKIRRKPGKT
jgi:hypothetical protein